ncbi:cytochrome c and c1 heme-lyase [Fomitiporia mediterranea MF3/22]|uniref:cytochrome c and c1 heme-lyase n=1 Tax=Fomitiporia mediterranea (strain MF3/22) TaxID=694068 RepID=UPI0004408710|nr:cytochrome c and c1 heme-lyase [Fomitiporia mediterranea MF3/22]EJD05738.1 cytochrome c and c1 heme-lyase [Fomitiporia mediterranea MF3/22]
MAQCPVDHSSSSSNAKPSSESLKSNTDKCPVDHSSLVHSSDTDSCPVDHNTRSTWARFFPASPSPSSSSGSNKNGTPAAITGTTSLPTSREVSTIPRADEQGANWVYPSEAQFFAAMARKNHTPRAEDMGVIVPIHNAVNERAWGEVLGWERGWGGERCGGVRLVSFKGRPKDRTPRAWMKTLLGYQAPFDRHDWVVDRCGTRVRYVIDFYTGKSPLAGNLAFYLDVRPALDDWGTVKMRATRFWERWVGPMPWSSAAPNGPGQTR